jgi:hypothetical protein
MPACQDMSLELNSVEFSELAAADNGKKGIRRCKEDFMCDLKLQWDSYKSVARIRLVKTESYCVCEGELESV